MTKTSWRDDYGRIVKGRAMSYTADGAGFRTVMPFENVHGNGGLLTTVGDLLKWNENFVAPKVGDAAMLAEQQRTRPLNNGRMQSYALGLMLGTHKGVRVVEHSGSTAGYRAHLARYPDAGVSVADGYLAGKLQPSAVTATYQLTTPEADAIAGLYRDSETGEPQPIAKEERGLRLGPPGPALFATSATRLIAENGTVVERAAADRLTVTDTQGNMSTLTRTAPASPTPAQLAELAGIYASDEAEVELTAAVEGNTLVLKRRSDATIKLTPAYPDAFGGSIGTVIFRRDAGRVTGMSVVQDRVWDLRFARRPASTRPTNQQ
jgi:hypothetical protein